MWHKSIGPEGPPTTAASLFGTRGPKAPR
ncbi:DUF6053 domain-containing protein [Lysobacter yananisis]